MRMHYKIATGVSVPIAWVAFLLGNHGFLPFLCAAGASLFAVKAFNTETDKSQP